MLFGNKEKAPSLPPCLLHRNAHRPKLPSKKAEALRKFGTGLEYCGLGPSASLEHTHSFLPVGFTPLQHLSCIVGGISRF